MAVDPLLGGEIMSGGMPPKKYNIAKKPAAKKPAAKKPAAKKPAAKKPAVRKAGCGCKL